MLTSEILAKGNEYNAAKNLSGNLNIILADSFYNIWRDQNDDYASYNVFRLSDMEDKEEVLGEVMKLGAHVHRFYIALQFFTWYKALPLEKR